MRKETARISLILDAVRRCPAISAAGIQPWLGIEALDDCAVVPISAETDLVVGSDFIRGTGFYLFKAGVLTYRHIGYYLIAANASDLAAMGATPLGVVVVARYTSEMSDDEFSAIMEGVVEACATFRMPLLGGDTGGNEECVLSAAAFGVCKRGQALRRSGGKQGDLIFLSGPVGRAGAAVAYFTRARAEGVRLSAEVEAGLAESWQRPSAAVRQGECLVAEGLSSCCIDTSDGLKAAVRQLGEASNLDVVLYADSIPVDPLSESVARKLAVDPLALAVSDSVDFRLVFSVERATVGRLRESFAGKGWDAFEIGEFRQPQGPPGVWLERDGKLGGLPGVEWDQGDVRAIDLLRGSKPEK